MSKAFDRFMVHVHIGSHPKFARLTDAEFRATIAGVLPLAAMSPLRGRLLIADQPIEPRDVAHQARVSTRVAKSAMDKLRTVGVIIPDEDLNCERIHDFEDWNPAPKTDTTGAERQARYRAKLKAQVTPVEPSRNAVTHGDVTPTEVEGEVKEGEEERAPARITGLHPQLPAALTELRACPGLDVEPAAVNAALCSRSDVDAMAAVGMVASWAHQGGLDQNAASVLLFSAFRKLSEQAARADGIRDAAGQRENAHPNGPTPFAGQRRRSPGPSAAELLAAGEAGG